MRYPHTSLAILLNPTSLYQLYTGDLEAEYEAKYLQVDLHTGPES